MLRQHIEIITSGDGDFDTIDGFNFQSNNTFNNISGVYDVQVRDKKGVALINEKL
jgi:hypothetical protein